MQEAGYCACGCGERTSVARQSRADLGHVKGEPVRWKVGHCNRPAGPPYEERDCGYSTPCWVWRWQLNENGYGRRGRELAHVLEYTKRHGQIPDDLELDHLCRNPPCCNPDHLEPVTHAVNMQRGASTKLTAAQAHEVKHSTEDAQAVAARLGITRSTVYRIRLGYIWKDIA